MLELKGMRLIIHLPAELDHHCTEEIRRKADRILREQPVMELEFDFAETVFMDSAGIGLILGRYKIMQVLEGRIIVSHMNEQIDRVLALSGIQNYVDMEREEAV
jgi:stage II sporulation protein AA (anti-sigma F factor antagonist)